MILSMAPMEGITKYVFRNAFETYFGGIDRYYTPFLSPKPKACMNYSERHDVALEHNQGIELVPQILTCDAEDFLFVGRELHETYGYQEINLNLGCPSGTVTKRGRGAGFLADVDKLDHFLEEIFVRADYGISIKTRLGIHNPEEIYRLLEVYQKYPLTELTVHARVLEDFYKNPADFDTFAAVSKVYQGRLVYNGDIYRVEDYEWMLGMSGHVEGVMLGRGLLRNLFLAEQIRCAEEGRTWQPKAEDGKRLKAFHDLVYQGYIEEMGVNPAIMHMKELWTYMHDMYAESDKPFKHIHKAKNDGEYRSAVAEMFRLELKTDHI